MSQLTPEQLKKTPYFLSFIEEFWMGNDANEKMANYHSGRLEVYDDTSEYAIEEIRFCTDDPTFPDFREQWDFTHVDRDTLKQLRTEIHKRYHSHQA